MGFIQHRRFPVHKVCGNPPGSRCAHLQGEAPEAGQMGRQPSRAHEGGWKRGCQV
jgi:hypothetical protein